MALTKNDLDSIQKIVKTETRSAIKTEVKSIIKTEVTPIVNNAITVAKKELTEKIEVESSLAAGVCKRGFDAAEKKNELAHKKLRLKIKDVKLLAQGIDRKLDAEVERYDDQNLKLKNHEERIIVLERKDKLKV